MQDDKNELTPYEGKEPFVFVSYSHKDDAKVKQIVERLQADGYRVWYDQGISPGDSWRGAIAQRVADCSLLVAFISDSYLKSKHCKREILYADEINRKIVLTYLEQVDLPQDMAMTFVELQRIAWQKSRNNTEEFCKELYRIPEIKDCYTGVTIKAGKGGEVARNKLTSECHTKGITSTTSSGVKSMAMTDGATAAATAIGVGAASSALAAGALTAGATLIPVVGPVIAATAFGTSAVMAVKNSKKESGTAVHSITETICHSENNRLYKELNSISSRDLIVITGGFGSGKTALKQIIEKPSVARSQMVLEIPADWDADKAFAVVKAMAPNGPGALAYMIPGTRSMNEEDAQQLIQLAEKVLDGKLTSDGILTKLFLVISMADQMEYHQLFDKVRKRICWCICRAYNNGEEDRELWQKLYDRCFFHGFEPTA